MPRRHQRPGDRRGRARFARWAAEALDDLPEPYHSQLDNVAIVVEDEPDERMRREIEDAEHLYGLYEGVPHTERGSEGWRIPDRITIFRKTIEATTSSPAEQREIVRETVLHEIAHHFGISDERLHELGRD